MFKLDYHCRALSFFLSVVIAFHLPQNTRVITLRQRGFLVWFVFMTHQPLEVFNAQTIFYTYELFYFKQFILV